MAKSKYSPALFELIDKGRSQSNDKLAVPKWWKSASKTDPQATSTTTEPTADAPQGSEGTTPADERNKAAETESPRAQGPESTEKRGQESGLTTAAPATGARPSDHGKPAPSGGRESTSGHVGDPGDEPSGTQIRIGQWAFKLNPLTGVIVIGTVLLLLIVSFQLGRSVPPDSQAESQTGVDALDRAMQQEPNPDVLGLDDRTDLADNSESPASQDPLAEGSLGPATRVQRTPGYNYVVLAHFRPDDRDEAEHAQAWLYQAKGIATTIEKASKGWYLVSVKGFDYPKDKQAALDFLETIKQAGVDYKKAFKGKRAINYTFQSPLIRKK